jgi:hypothetical protein
MYRTFASSIKHRRQSNGILWRRRIGLVAVEEMEQLGKHVFRGAVAAPYLEKHGLPNNFLDNPKWVKGEQTDQVCSIFGFKQQSL